MGTIGSLLRRVSFLRLLVGSAAPAPAVLLAMMTDEEIDRVL